MLKTFVSPLIAVALFSGGSAGCVSHNPPSRPIPNIVVAHTTGEALLVINATTGRLTLLPSPAYASDPQLVLAPGQSKRLDFILTEEQNRGDNVVSEIVLDAEHSSHYLRQPETDLVLRARFASAIAAKEIRIGIGQCLLQEQPLAGGHPVQINRLPTPGVPFLRLCAE
jgi:hypothetical protein